MSGAAQTEGARGRGLPPGRSSPCSLPLPHACSRLPHMHTCPSLCTTPAAFRMLTPAYTYYPPCTTPAALCAHPCLCPSPCAHTYSRQSPCPSPWAHTCHLHLLVPITPHALTPAPLPALAHAAVCAHSYRCPSLHARTYYSCVLTPAVLCALLPAALHTLTPVPLLVLTYAALRVHSHLFSDGEELLRGRVPRVCSL